MPVKHCPKSITLPCFPSISNIFVLSSGAANVTGFFFHISTAHIS